MNLSSLVTFLSAILPTTLNATSSNETLTLEHHTQIIHDEARHRDIPVTLYFPNTNNCNKNAPCKVAIFGAGYGMANTDYTFLAKQLNQQGVLMVSIAHELANDPPLSREQPFVKTRNENWQRGAQTVLFVRQALKSQYSEYNFDAVTLMGHSNGGDISALLANQGHSFIDAVITYDHRRVPLPRTKDIKILSVRASDYPADDKVLPTQAEQLQFNSCVVSIANARHNDMADHGPQWLKQQMSLVTAEFLHGKSCKELDVLLNNHNINQ